MSRDPFRNYDTWKTNGYWHKCEKCGVRWSDSDGGCACEVEPGEKPEYDIVEEACLAMPESMNEFCKTAKCGSKFNQVCEPVKNWIKEHYPERWY